MKKLLLVIFYLVFVHFTSAQSIIVTGDWNYTIPTSDITEAGTDFSGTYESDVDQVDISIRYNRNWVVSINQNNIDWNNKIRLWIRRTGNGAGSGQIYGGENYIRIRNIQNEFFTGYRTRNHIPIQFQINNVSTLIPAHNYIVEIVFTLTYN